LSKILFKASQATSLTRKLWTELRYGILEHLKLNDFASQLYYTTQAFKNT